MDLEDQLGLEHLLFVDRKCRSCGEVKDLIDGFYRTRKGRGAIPSSYAYECKVCTIKRVLAQRDNKLDSTGYTYPDW